jgi:hypothetical protein
MAELAALVVPVAFPVMQLQLTWREQEALPEQEEVAETAAQFQFQILALVH